MDEPFASVARGATMIDAVPIVGGVGFPQTGGTGYLKKIKKKKKTKNTQTSKRGWMCIIMHTEIFYCYDLRSRERYICIRRRGFRT